MQKETRYLKANLRTTVDGKPTIEGYAAKVGVISEDLGGFREVLMPGCFDLASSPDIICNLEHNDTRMLGRTISGTLQVSVDDVGLMFRCVPPNTVDGQTATELIGREDLQHCSFCFYLNEDGTDETWINTEDGPLRQINHLIVGDVSIVVHPAYPNTEVGLRSFQRYREQEQITVADELELWRMKIDLSEKLYLPA